MTLSEIGNIPIDISVLESMFPNLKSIQKKIEQLQQSGKLINLKKGMYAVSPQETGKQLSVELIANHLCAPSYISMESALQYYGLIPRCIDTIRSLTTGESKSYENSLGTFEYFRCPEKYFPLGIRLEVKDNASFLIACPEKALCDLIIHTSNMKFDSQNELLTYLIHDLNLNMKVFHQMDSCMIEQCAQTSRKKHLITTLLKIMKRRELSITRGSDTIK